MMKLQTLMVVVSCFLSSVDVLELVSFLQLILFDHYTGSCI